MVHGAPDDGFEIEFTHPDPLNPSLLILSSIPGLPEFDELNIRDRDKTMMKFFVTDFTEILKTIDLDGI
jgi:hypothetical protein